MRFASTFVPGFEQVIAATLPKYGKSVKVEKVYSGLAIYQHHGEMGDLAKLDMVNNTFLILGEFTTKRDLSFDRMVAQMQRARVEYPLSYFKKKKMRSFRVRFSHANKFEKVDRNIQVAAEQTIARATRMSVSREGADCELWYVIRSEGFAFYGLLLEKQAPAPVRQGELKPEYAALMMAWAGVADGMRVLDPCAGYGALPQAVLRHLPRCSVIACDKEPALVKQMQSRLGKYKDRVTVLRQDMTTMPDIPDASVDVILADPPWGIYDKVKNLEGLYVDMLKSFVRVLKPQGYMVILTAARDEFTGAVARQGLSLMKADNTLVNGKKATLYMIGPKA